MAEVGAGLGCDWGVVSRAVNTYGKALVAIVLEKPVRRGNGRANMAVIPDAMAPIWP